MAMILTGAITGCGSDSATGAAAATTPAITSTTPATITGLSTPKSVSVVTAN
jgi:hypothetical protein